jgi:predicted NAD/FAD-dependent oxidoreductase
MAAALREAAADPVHVAMLAFPADAAPDLPFDITEVTDADLAKVVRGESGGLTTVVLHSTHGFSARHAAITGNSSSTARISGDYAKEDVEKAAAQELLAAFDRLGAAIGREWPRPCVGPVLHRWSSAFPHGLNRPEPAWVASDARIALAGDFLGGTASVENAMLSGFAAADAILETANKSDL